MFCSKCHNDFPGNCTCADRDERLNKIMGSPHVGLRWCKACDQHADLCKCKDGPSTAIRIPKPQNQET